MILIENMKMPESCTHCPMNKDKGFCWEDVSYCALTFKQTFDTGRNKSCPLKEVNGK